MLVLKLCCRLFLISQIFSSYLGLITFLIFFNARSIGNRSWAIPGSAGSSWPGTLASARVRGGPGGSSCLSPGSRGAGPGSGSGSRGSGGSVGGSWLQALGSGGSVGSGVVLSCASSGVSSNSSGVSCAENRKGSLSGISKSSDSGSGSSKLRCWNRWGANLQLFL